MSIQSIRNLDYVILLCRDIAKMRSFYRDVLGFNLKEDREDWVEFQIGSGHLTLRPRGRWYDGEAEDEGASVQLSFRVTPEGVNTAYQQLIENLVQVLEPLTDQTFGHRTLYFKDPEGNIWRFMQKFRISKTLIVNACSRTKYHHASLGRKSDRQRPVNA